MNTVLCLGEIVVDWIRAAGSGDANSGSDFEYHLAGVPANVAVALARLGVNSAMIARIGADNLAVVAKRVLTLEGVDINSVTVAPSTITRSARVERLPNGERRGLALDMENCADRALSAEDIDESRFASASALYFGSTALSCEPVQSATKKAIALAKSHDLLVVGDANIWPAMWESDEVCRKTILSVLKDIDVLKVNQDELAFLTGSRDLESAERLLSTHNLALVAVTMSESGAFVATKNGSFSLPTFNVEVKEVAGAGDAFVASLTASLLSAVQHSEKRRQALKEIEIIELVQIVLKANAAGALVASRLGALCAMPRQGEIESLVKAGFTPLPLRKGVTVND